jgi:flagellar biosynthesis protein FlhA
MTALDQARGLGSRIANLRIHIARTFGLILPDVRITDTDELAPGDYQIRIHGVIRGRGTLRAGEVLALGPDPVLAGLNGASVREPVYSSPARWIARDDQDDAATLGATVVTPMEVLSTHLMEVVKSNLAALMTLSAMQRQIEELKSLSDPTRAERNRRHLDGIMPEKVTPETLLAILRALLEERISIRNLPLIVDAICEFRNLDQIEAIYELVRKRLRGHPRLLEEQPGVFVEFLVADCLTRARKSVFQCNQPGVRNRVGVDFHSGQHPLWGACEETCRQVCGPKIKSRHHL